MKNDDKREGLTDLLKEWRGSTNLRKREAGDRLFDAIYEDLVRIASGVNFSKEVDPNDLVHQLYMKWQGDAALKEWKSRVEFFNVAKAALRNLVIDRYRSARKHRTTALPAQAAAKEEAELEYLRCDDAIAEIQEKDPVLGQILLMKYYSPDTDEQIAKAFEVSEATVKRYFKKADEMLRARLNVPAKQKK